MAHIVDE